MKKNLILPVFMIILIMLSGCNHGQSSVISDTPLPDPAKLTMENASKVNTVAYLLEKYKTVTYAQLDYISGDTVHKIFYTDESGKHCATGDCYGYTDYQTDYLDFYNREPGEPVYTVSAAKDTYVSDYMFVVPGGEFTSQTTDVNGNLVCVAEVNISQEYADQLSEFWPATTEDKMITNIIFASDDNRVLSINFTIRRPDGSELKIASGVLLYNQEVAYTNAVKAYLDAEKVTVSVNMEDGKTRTAEIPKGETFEWYCDDGYTLYLDKNGNSLLPEKTEPVQDDMILYCLPKK